MKIKKLRGDKSKNESFTRSIFTTIVSILIFTILILSMKNVFLVDKERTETLENKHIYERLRQVPPKQEKFIETRRYLDLGNKYFLEGRMESAIESYLKSIELESKKSDAYNNLGALYQDLGDLKSSEEAYQRALYLDHDHTGALYNLGMLYQDQKRTEEAYELYERALVLEPQNGDIWSNFGACSHALGHIDVSINAYEKALTYKLKESVVDNQIISTLYEHLGRAYLKRDSDKYAYESFQASIRYNPENEISKYLLSSIKLNKETANTVHSELCSEDTLVTNGEDVVPIAPAGYVKQLFDDYSSTFESSLHSLQYRVPDLISAHLHPITLTRPPSLSSPDSHAPKPASLVEYDVRAQVNMDVAESSEWKPWASVVDLGCGTGLMGSQLANATNTLIGIDLSDKMLAIAEEKGVYHYLFVGDILEFLRALVRWRAGREAAELGDVRIRRKLSGSRIKQVEQVSFEGFGGAFSVWEAASPVLVVAADVFVYIGDLSSIFRELSLLCRTGDIFAFTVEKLEPSLQHHLSSPGGTADATASEENVEYWRLQKTGRFAHSKDYIEYLTSTSFPESFPTGIRPNSSDAEGTAGKVWEIVTITDILPRIESGKPVTGLLVILRKI